ncbi:hypothetical protein B0H13DRAFT_1907200 [Mycena leptocephala]|nr:hypothetical protein B0H13DRAFT_1907200 [Mycena leptocephala]
MSHAGVSSRVGQRRQCGSGMRINGDPLKLQETQVVIQPKSAGEGRDDSACTASRSTKSFLFWIFKRSLVCGAVSAAALNLHERTHELKTVPPAVLVDRTPNLPHIEALMSKQERQAQRSKCGRPGRVGEVGEWNMGPAFQPDFWGQQLEVRMKLMVVVVEKQRAKSNVTRLSHVDEGVHFLMCQLTCAAPIDCFDLHVALGGAQGPRTQPFSSPDAYSETLPFRIYFW